MSGRVVVLNGTSSSGKTTLARALRRERARGDRSIGMARMQAANVLADQLQLG